MWYIDRNMIAKREKMAIYLWEENSGLCSVASQKSDDFPPCELYNPFFKKINLVFLFSIHIFQCTDNIKTTKNKLKIQLGYPVYCIM